MTRKLRRLVPSPAMVVALTALFLALGGSAYALVITGKTIRNNTVTGKDIRNGTLKAKDVGRTPWAAARSRRSASRPVPVGRHRLRRRPLRGGDRRTARSRAAAA